ncbi:TPA: hypothetical protein N2898_004486 [Vibrio parahaemolyticus]|uniref:hypothetical protein n=1 Tax=Vibrio parahaemolyticus TaxID=670 RepID=UPI00193FA0A0|nr:hypothetical protein [Vibrio parahaemolyticus]MBM4855673.1 hypothetical protein [Vibrio parahaemolyticus]WMN97359.1 hypothetical protein NI380_07130 [Vibrio parahaemolyticus]HCM1290388.1 hypothetical protein [Vibrio parahaemolyticus]
MQFPEGVYLFYVESQHDEDYDNFSDELSQIGVPSVTLSRPESGLYACNEWLIPTTIVAGISAGFLSEVGKDLYQTVKNKMAGLCTKTMRKPRIEPVFAGTDGKINPNNPYSSAFSIYSNADLGRRFKLLVPKFSPDVDYNKIVHAYLDFLKDYNDGSVSEKDIGLDLENVVVSSTILVHFNEVTQQIEWLDHLPLHVREGMQML